MAAAATGIWNHITATGQSLVGTGANPLAKTASPMDSSSSSSSDSATISANDFLTLLVTEMQNQDPTADTDPNEYINQLVSVNSLEQLIDINATLTKDAGSSSSASASPQNASGVAAKAAAQLHAASGPGANPAGKVISGNLSVPAGQSAAQGVAHALSGRHRPS
jgi:flagellar basal-body rod modification protein FlgD